MHAYFIKSIFLLLRPSMSVLGSASGTGIYKRVDKYQVGLYSIAKRTEREVALRAKKKA